MLHRLTILVLVFAVSVLGAVDVHADSVRIRATKGDGFGRITFRWPQPVGHQAQRQGDQLVVNFSRPIEANFDVVTRTLGSLVAGIAPAPNNASVAFRIRGEFSVRSYDSGSSIVVDIVGAGQTADAEPSPTPEVTAAPVTNASGPNIRVRTGVHDAYSRLVFDWPSNTSFEVIRDGGKAIVQFGKPGQSDVSRLASGRIRNIAGASVSSVDGNLSVTLDVDATSQIKAFTSGSKVVVDVYAPGTQEAAPELAAKPEPEPTPEPEATVEQTAQGDEPPAPQSAPVEPVEVAQTTTEDSVPTTSEASAAPLSLEPKTTEPEAAGPSEPPAQNLAEDRVNTRAQASKVGDVGVALKFNWDEPVGAAVFRRGEDLWVVFDKRAKIDTEALLQDGAGLITSVEQVPSQNGAVLRMRTPEDINPEIKRAGLAWLLEFLPQPLIPSAPLQADSQPDSPLGARLFVSVPEPGRIIAFRDPEMGDNLVAVPVIPLGHGMSRVWSYPQLRFLPSKQGVVMKPLTDDLSIRPLRQGVEVTSTADLLISAVSAEDKANVELQQQLAASTGILDLRALTRVLDLEKWKRPDLLDFTGTKQKLQREIAFAKNSRTKKEAQRELMFFLFSNGFNAETVGLLQEMVRVDPEYANEPEYLLVKGAASWLMGRMADARESLFDAKLNEFDEATFWRAAVIAGEGKLPDSAYELRQTGAITQPYPKAIKMPMATLVADAAIELGDVKQATQYLEVLSVDNPSRAQRDQIELVSGRIKEVSGDDEGAVSDWESVMEGRHRPSRARAAVARTELLLKLDHYTPADAIEEYEKLRFVWRGDEFEFKLLRRLGSLYLEQKQFRDGLRTLRQAATYFPDNEGTNQVTKQMSDAFHMLYLEDGADILPPVTAIALYDEFRELTPPGDLGDEMIRNLADRLVGVDLLDRAAALLESQIEFRLSGELKSRVGARLALIQLFDRRFDAAIETLNVTATPDIDNELKSQRQLLRAQAHIGLGESDKALELLLSEVGREAELLRSGIYWDAGDWKNASKALTKLTRELGVRPRKPIDDIQAAVVLALAVAHTLDGNEVAITRMQGNFADAMAKGPYADAFKLIAEPPETGLVDFRGLEPIVETVDNFQGFMELYRERVNDGQLSSLY